MCISFNQAEIKHATFGNCALSTCYVSRILYFHNKPFHEIYKDDFLGETKCPKTV